LIILITNCKYKTFVEEVTNIRDAGSHKHYFSLHCVKQPQLGRRGHSDRLQDGKTALSVQLGGDFLNFKYPDRIWGPLSLYFKRKQRSLPAMK
jgi:hypothetical protein